MGPEIYHQKKKKKIPRNPAKDNGTQNQNIWYTDFMDIPIINLIENNIYTFCFFLIFQSDCHEKTYMPSLFLEKHNLNY